jgi:hypothetical protein
LCDFTASSYDILDITSEALGFAVVKAPGSKSFSKAAIAGIVVGVAVLVAALSVFAFVWFTRKKWSKVPQKSFGKLRYFFSS